MKIIPIIFSLILIQFSSGIKNPIVIIPGLGGSKIHVKMDKDAKIDSKCLTDSRDFFMLYINVTYAMYHTPGCMFKALSMTYDKKTRQTENLPGIHTGIKNFGSVDSVRYAVVNSLLAIPYFEILINTLEKEGYTPGLSIRAAPYDFRKSPSEYKEYFERLKALIEDIYNENEKEKVVIMTHSLGGPISLVFLHQQSQEWKDQYIKSEISLGSSWAGAVKAVDSYIHGYGFHGTEFIPNYWSDPFEKRLKEAPYPYTIIPEIPLIPKELLRTFPAVIWSFPSPAAWNTTEELIQLNGKDYTLENMEQFFSDLGEPSGWEMYKDIYPFVKELPEPGINLHCLYGYDIPTVARVKSSNSWWNKFRYPIYGDGDGFVNLQSLEVCKNWIGGKKNVTVKTFWGVHHVFSILLHSDVLDYIVQLVRSD